MASDHAFTVAVEEHFALPAVMERTADVLQARAPGAARDNAPKLVDLGSERIAAMDADGVDVQVVSHAAPGLEFIAGPEAAALAREANDALLDAIARHPGRLAGLAALPVGDPGAATSELERAIARGLSGAIVNGMVDGRFLDDERFDDLLVAAEALGVPVYVHPGLPHQAVADAYYSGISDDVDRTLATAAWGWHSETAVHVLRMILAGVFDRHPGLQIIVGHMGEMLPAMAARAGKLLDGIAGLQQPLLGYFAHNVHISTAGVFDPDAYRSAVSLVGIDRMMFAIDYPFTPGGPAAAFLRDVVDPADLPRLAGENAVRLLRLRGTSSDR